MENKKDSYDKNSDKRQLWQKDKLYADFHYRPL